MCMECVEYWETQNIFITSFISVEEEEKMRAKLTSFPHWCEECFLNPSVTHADHTHFLCVNGQTGEHSLLRIEDDHTERFGAGG